MTTLHIRLLALLMGVFMMFDVHAIAPDPKPETDTAAEEAEVSRQVEAFHASLVAAMNMETHGERQAHLEPQIADLFDLERISRVSLGRTWGSLSTEDREQFSAALFELIVATYADRFDEFNEQVFTTQKVQSVKRNGYVVRTRVRGKERTVDLDYFFRNGKVFNVVADGVSDLSLRRADYNQIIKTEGFEELMAHIKRKTAEARGL